MDFSSFNLNRFEFVDDREKASTFREKARRFRAYLIDPRTGAGPSPVALRKEYDAKPDLFFKLLFGAIGFKTSLTSQAVAYHSDRLYERWRIRKNLYLVLTFLISIVPAVGFSVILKKSLPQIESQPYKYRIVAAITVGLMYATFILLMFVIARMVRKTTEALTIRRFADSICALTIAYLVIELTRDDVLSNTQKRASLLTRVNDLARNTRFLAARFRSRSSVEQDWAWKHFRHMERYIRDRERWIIVPKNTTLADLRRDFYKLAQIYVSGDYGQFDWSTVTMPLEPTIVTRKQQFFTSMPRFLGIVFPLVILGVLLWQHPRLTAIGVGVNIIALILVSWFLLAVDAIFKLGIVSGVINLANEIKNLK